MSRKAKISSYELDAFPVSLPWDLPQPTALRVFHVGDETAKLELGTDYAVSNDELRLLKQFDGGCVVVACAPCPELTVGKFGRLDDADVVSAFDQLLDVTAYLDNRVGVFLGGAVDCDGRSPVDVLIERMNCLEDELTALKKKCATPVKPPEPKTAPFKFTQPVFADGFGCDQPAFADHTIRIDLPKTVDENPATPINRDLRRWRQSNDRCVEVGPYKFSKMQVVAAAGSPQMRQPVLEC